MANKRVGDGFIGQCASVNKAIWKKIFESVAAF
jgi:hypothetical protein